MPQKPSAILLWLAIIAIIVTGIVHFIDAPDAFHEVSYKGWLFCLNGLGAVLAAVGIYLGKKSWGWNLGFLIAALSIILYAFSRTVGLPGLPAEPDEWFEPLGVVSLLAESIFVVVFITFSKADKHERRQ